MRKWIFTPDKHIGWQQRPGGSGLEPLHDLKAIKAMLAFARDFEPDVWIEGGDNLDCGPVSHWLSDKKLASKDLDIDRDVKLYTKEVLEPINEIMQRRSKNKKERIWMIGNHENWLFDAAERNPGIASRILPERMLDLKDWTVIPQGGYYKLGKLYFIHGDTLGNGQNMAGRAVVKMGHPVLFGHFHTFQVATHYEMLDVESPKCGMAIPGLCAKNANYLEGKPSQWLKGFAYGYSFDDGTFQVYVPVILGGKFVANGRVYRG